MFGVFGDFIVQKFDHGIDSCLNTITDRKRYVDVGNVVSDAFEWFVEVSS
jgi:hypothetical protein